MLIEKDSKDRFQCTVTRYNKKKKKKTIHYINLFSTTQQTKTKTGVYESKGRYFLLHNSLTDVRKKQKILYL